MLKVRRLTKSHRPQAERRISRRNTSPAFARCAPFIAPVHGVPDDFWRYTPRGAALLLEEAGLAVR